MRLRDLPRYPYMWFALPRRIRDLRAHGTVSDWVGFARRTPFMPIQVPSEITAFIERVAERRPQTVLEIGTEGGGTLLLLTLAASPTATVISVDMPIRPYGGYPVWKGAYYQRFALPAQRLHLVRGNSHLLRTRDQVSEILAGRPVDVLFIDGDHSYGGSKADWKMYGPLVAPDGLVAFHDIVRHPPETGCEVFSVWQELKPQFKSWEIVASANQTWGGIGVIWPGRGPASSSP